MERISSLFLIAGSLALLISTAGLASACPDLECRNFTEQKNRDCSYILSQGFSEGDQAWSMLRLKKEILQKFPQLRDKSSAKFIYEMHVCRNYEDFKKHIADLEKTKIVPILFHIGIEEK